VKPGEVHLAFGSPEAILARCLDRASALVTAEERARHDRFFFEPDRLQYAATRSLARVMLSRYAPVAPRDWVFREGPHGKPAIAGPEGAPALRFNLSNTRSLVACAVTLDHEIGVDVEEIDRPGETVTIAERFFSPSEVAALRALPAGEQRERFFEYWTLKEAYIKALGARSRGAAPRVLARARAVRRRRARRGSDRLLVRPPR